LVLQFFSDSSQSKKAKPQLKYNYTMSAIEIIPNTITLIEFLVSIGFTDYVLTDLSVHMESMLLHYGKVWSMIVVGQRKFNVSIPLQEQLSMSMQNKLKRFRHSMNLALHPDKNSSPNAANEFMEFNKKMKLLIELPSEEDMMCITGTYNQTVFNTETWASTDDIYKVLTQMAVIHTKIKTMHNDLITKVLGKFELRKVELFKIIYTKIIVYMLEAVSKYNWTFGSKVQVILNVVNEMVVTKYYLNTKFLDDVRGGDVDVDGNTNNLCFKRQSNSIYIASDRLTKRINMLNSTQSDVSQKLLLSKWCKCMIDTLEYMDKTIETDDVFNTALYTEIKLSAIRNTWRSPTPFKLFEGMLVVSSKTSDPNIYCPGVLRRYGKDQFRVVWLGSNSTSTPYYTKKFDKVKEDNMTIRPVVVDGYTVVVNMNKKRRLECTMIDVETHNKIDSNWEYVFDHGRVRNNDNVHVKRFKTFE
jgi:hypothetical protein